MREALNKLLSMALPMISMRLVQTLNTFILMVILAQLGHAVLAASFSIGMLRIVLMLTFMSPLFALGAITGRQYGTNQTATFPGLIQQAWLTALILSVIPMLLMAMLESILRLCQQPEAIIPYVGQYFHYFLFAIPAIYLGVVNQQFLAGIKRQKIVLLLGVFNLALSAFLYVGLILGHFGLPKLGVIGGGIATIIASWLGFILSTAIAISSIKKTHPFKRALTGFQWGKLLAKVGMPIGFKTGSEMLMLFVFAIMVGWLGKIALAASQISNEYMMLAILPLFGLSEACSIVVGHVAGDKNHAQLKQHGRAALGLAMIITLARIFHDVASISACKARSVKARGENC